MSLDFIKTIPQHLYPHRALNALAQNLANATHVGLKNYLIKWFIAKYQVNMQEAITEDPYAYSSFNDFFIRQLKPDCRPIAKEGIVSPVDGNISEIGRIDLGQLLQAKGRYYSVSELLACEPELANKFDSGLFATLYLSPKDYHRVHMPMDAELTSMTYIPGSLFSVQPMTARVIPKLFARNERLVVFFQTDLGPMVMVLVGAAIVGAIEAKWHGVLKRGNKVVRYNYKDKFLHKGDEMGYFKLGSTVVLLFADSNKVQWDKNLRAGSPLQYGQKIASETK